jgi:hypothetical protein
MGRFGENDQQESRTRSFPPAGLRAIKPTSAVLRRSALATGVFLVPFSVILYLITVPKGPWDLVLATEVIVLLVLLLSVIGFRRAGFWVGPEGIAERGFFGAKRFVPVSEIDSVVVVEHFENSESDSIPQLFVCDANGKQLVRMRGQFWSRESMDFVSETLPVPIKEVTDPVTAAELLDEYPGLLYWFERHPTIAATMFSAAVIVGGVALYFVLGALGVTSVSA